MPAFITIVTSPGDPTPSSQARWGMTAPAGTGSNPPSSRLRCAVALAIVDMVLPAISLTMLTRCCQALRSVYVDGGRG